MFRNYLAAALRNLVRNRLFTILNIVGLAAGFTAFVLIAVYVRDELTFDRWIPEHERTYLVQQTDATPGRAFQYLDATPAEFAAWMKLDYPGIEHIARIIVAAGGGSGNFRRGDIEGSDQLDWADPAFFKVLKLPALYGDLSAALDNPGDLVLTRKLAEKYFGRADVVGETLEFDRQHVMKITAVLEDIPSNSNISLGFIGSGRTSYGLLSELDAKPQAEDSFLIYGFTYFKLKPGASIDEIRKDMDAFVLRHKRPSPEIMRTFPLVAIADVHLSSGNNFLTKPRGSLATIRAISAVGFLIVAIACINFVNLMTARATRRAVEVGVRKAVGAARRNLILQFLGESFIYVALAVLAAHALAYLAVPLLATFLQRTLMFGLLSEPSWLITSIGGTLIVAAAAGAYPAFVLSAFRPAIVLKTGDMRGSGSGRVRETLVVLQFAVLVGLAITTGVITRQTFYALNDGLRFDTDQVVIQFTNCKGAFDEEAARLPGVRAAACGSYFALNIGGDIANDAFLPDGTTVSVSMHSVAPGHLELYGLAPLAGRFFTNAAADVGPPRTLYGGTFDDAPDGWQTRMVINEAAVRRLGFASPEAAIGQTVKFGPRGGSSEIIGIVADFATDSARRPANATSYFVDPDSYSMVSIKLDGSQIPETLKALDALWKEVGDPRPIQRNFVSQIVEDMYRDIRLQSQMFAVFAGIAMFIACLGLLGLASFIAEQRTKEIGIRKVMGASQADVLRIIVWQFTKPVLLANVIAWPVAGFLMQRWLEGFADHIELSLWMFIAASALALVIAIATVLGHALIVARAQPVTALRYE